MQVEIKGKIFNIQRFSVDDGDGIRTCVFLKGCPLRCVWCHNPESRSFSAETAFYPQKCILCGACVSGCRNGCHEISCGKHVFRRENCTNCGTCSKICPARAIETAGRDAEVQDVLSVVLRDAPFYGSRGGVTITGGEPLAQPEFTIALAMAAKEAGITTAVETSGFGRKEDFQNLMNCCDMFLFDCKASSEDHMRLTGVKDDTILENLDLLCSSAACVTLRCPIVPGANLTEAYVEKLIQLGQKYPNLCAVELLPYHATGISKVNRFGMQKPSAFAAPTAEQLNRLKKTLEANTAVPVRIRGRAADDTGPEP
ncbi:MAG: glycyl-radical enzyme activating protein [Anaerovoracaceae bacterium]|jgi:glycyl-radical enzyme activating protein|nr:glycyl-radical enzyme activating protein [Bacteroidales bacterium]